MDKHSFPNGKRLVRDTLKPDDNLHYEKFSDGTVKCIEDEIPFDVPNNWEWCRLQTICAKEIKRGKAPKYEEKSSVIVFAQKCNTKSGFIDISKAKFLAQNTLKKYADEDFLYYNDIIINSTGTGTLGRVGIYKKEDDIYNIKIVPDSHITTVRTIPSEINAQYIYYFLKFNQLYFENSGVGSTNQKELKPEVISTFLIAIPPLNEQNAIIDKVNMVNKHLSNLDNEKEQLKELISSTKSKILDLSIRGKLVPQDPNDEPASVLLERIRAEKEELIKQGKIKRDKKESVIFKGDDNSYYLRSSDNNSYDVAMIFNLPKNWEWCLLGDIFNVSSSKRVLKNEWKSSGVPFYRAREIVKLSINGTVDNDLFISPEHYENLRKNYGVPNAGDLMVTGVGTIGKVYIVKENDVFYYKDASVLCFENIYKAINPKFAKLMLDSSLIQNQIHSKTYGNTVDTITISTAKNYLCVLPPLAEQKRIVDEIEKIFAVLDDIANQVA